MSQRPVIPIGTKEEAEWVKRAIEKAREKYPNWASDPVAFGQALREPLLEYGMPEAVVNAIIDEETGYDASVSDMMLLEDLGPRRATTRQLRTIINEGIKARFNRRYLDTEQVPALDPNGVHVFIPIVVHRFIDQAPAPQHIRCRVLIKTLTSAEAQEVILDVHDKSLRRLSPLKPKRHPKPDPTWEHVLEWYVDLVETTRTNPAKVDFSDGDLMVKFDNFPMPLDLLQPTDPWYMTADMVTLVSAAAEGMPSAKLHISDLVTTSGFLVLEEPFYLDTIQWGVVPIRALVWKLIGQEGIKGWPGSSKLEPNVACMALMDLEHEDSTDDVNAPGYRSRLWPVVHWLWPEGQPVDSVYDWVNLPDDRQVQTFMEMRKFFMATWLLSGQRIAGIIGQKPVRGLRRRAERLKLPSTVLVVRLRRETAREYDDDREPQQIEWSHRWLVTGHWRRIWDKKEQRVRLIWVSPYIKGPDEKPLIIKDRIIKFER